ncbi:hypothetical protein G3D97_005071, partial [Salmonella enterica subsp. enterica]|nr:hypothetical protein [Salmonella enterica subsp. enterica serovar Minnesota]EDW2189944.1 hypothetical protein [Salmonella enterica subsp. enterica]EEH7223333.1 hypothetical protein [Salmonella enterica subsp. enterica]
MMLVILPLLAPHSVTAPGFFMLSTYEPEQIIEAGLALQAEGRNITG